MKTNVFTQRNRCRLRFGITSACVSTCIILFLRCNSLIMMLSIYCQLIFIRIAAGNKCDLADDREVPTSSGSELAKLDQLSFLETSAKSADNVEVLFTKMAAMLRQEAVKTGRPAARGMSDSFVVQGGGASSLDQKSTCCWLM